MELYRKVRIACNQHGMSKRAAALHFSISRDTVTKILAYAEPPGYRRTAPVKRPKLDGFTELIDQILLDDRGRPRKQHHTAKRIFERLCDEHGFDGSYTIVKDYVFVLDLPTAMPVTFVRIPEPLLKPGSMATIMRLCSWVPCLS